MVNGSRASAAVLVVREQRVVWIAQRPLPEPEVTGGHVEIAAQPAELLEVRVLVDADALAHVQVPAVEHRDATADVAQRDDQVEVSPSASTIAPPPGTLNHRWSANMTFSAGSWKRDVTRTGRSPASRARSAAEAVRFDDRTAANVATASTSVPLAVAIEAIVDQSATRPRYAAAVTSIAWRIGRLPASSCCTGCA